MRRLLKYLICLPLVSCQSGIDTISDVEMLKSDSLTIEQKQSEDGLDTLINIVDYLILGEKLAKVKVVSEAEVDNFPTFEIVAGYRNDVIIGENIEHGS